MIVMLGESDLTMYGTPHGHGLLRHLLKAVSTVCTTYYDNRLTDNIKSSSVTSNTSMRVDYL